MTHAVETKHPLYISSGRMSCRSCVTPARREGGEGAATQYLPQPSGFSAHADRRKALYDAYKKRTQFPEIVHPAVHGRVGVIHRTEAQTEMPAAMQALWEKATKRSGYRPCPHEEWFGSEEEREAAAGTGG